MGSQIHKICNISSCRNNTYNGSFWIETPKKLSRENNELFNPNFKGRRKNATELFEN